MSTSPDDQDGADLLEACADVVAAYLGQNTMPAAQVPDLIRSVYSAFGALSGASPPQTPVEKQKPAVAISRSVQDEYIVCLEDGARLKMLKRYLGARYQMTPDDYRRKWGLPDDYPMVAPAYAAKRSAYAKKIGLGRGVRRK
ncbi:MAG: MucR family transcriptional regulator [Caulobacteraceae bacterium]|nr:MucR family transcriptional regulator [Caulobacteraceae bacterium]